MDVVEGIVHYAPLYEGDFLSDLSNRYSYVT